jgi:D-alanyl-D-alanine carboxypeptidase
LLERFTGVCRSGCETTANEKGGLVPRIFDERRPSFRSALVLALALAAVPLLALVTTTARAASSQTTAGQAPSLATLTEDLTENAFAPGAAAVSLTASGREAAAAGYRDLDQLLPMEVETRVRAGSTTKTFTAVVTLQLVAEGKLSLGDTVEQWLPGLLPDGSRITIRELLNHTSGLFNYTRDPFVRSTWGTDNVPSPAELVAIAAGYPLDFDPGTGWRYSNTGYQVLGLIIERVTGRSLREEMAARIFRPLGLGATDLVPERDIPGPHAQGYYLYTQDPRIDVTRTTFGQWADGAIVSNAPDLARFYRALFRGELLTPQMMVALKATVETGGFSDGEQAGLGIFRTHLSCGWAWENSGGVAGFLAKVLASGDGHRVVVFVTNGFLDEGPDTQLALDGAAEEAFCAG